MRWRTLAQAACAAALALPAEQGVLVVHVTDARDSPLSGVVLATRGDGSVGPPTDRAGRTRIRLAPETRPANWVSLQVVRPRELVFLSPWDSRVRVPPFENEAENFAPIVLAARGDRVVLEQGKTLASLAALINAAASPRESAVGEIARLFDVDAVELDRALRRLKASSGDPYERGMAALYTNDFSHASRDLAQALETRKTKLNPAPAGIVNAALFLGHALREQGKYDEAAAAYREALALRPDDAEILNALGISLIKGGKAAEAEPILRKALELQQGKTQP